MAMICLKIVLLKLWALLLEAMSIFLNPFMAMLKIYFIVLIVSTIPVIYLVAQSSKQKILYFKQTTHSRGI